MEKQRRGQSDSNPAISNQLELLRTRAIEHEDERSNMDTRQNPDQTEHADQTTSKPASDPKKHLKSPPTHKKSQNKQHKPVNEQHKPTDTAAKKKNQHRPNNSHNQQGNQKHVPQRPGSNQKHAPSTKPRPNNNNHHQRPPPPPPHAAVQHKAPPPPPKAPPPPVKQPIVIPAVVPRPQNVPPAPVHQDRVIPPPQVAAPLPVGDQKPIPIPAAVVKPVNISDTALPALPVVSAITPPKNTTTVPVPDEGKNAGQGSNYATLAVQNGNNTHSSNTTSPFVDPASTEKVWGQSAITESSNSGLSKSAKAVVIFCVPLGALILCAALYKLWKMRRSKGSRVESILVTRSRPTTISDVFGGREPEESSFGHQSAFQSLQNGSQRNSSYHSDPPPMPINVAMPLKTRGSDEKLKEKPGHQDKDGLIEPNLNIRGNHSAFIRQSEETGYEDSLETRVMSHDLSSTRDNIAIVARTFDPFLPDELVINPGDRVRVEMVYDDGWCFGTNLDADRHRTAGGSTVVSTGVFPQDCLQKSTDTDSVSDRSGFNGNASCVNTIHTFGKPEAGSIECLDTTEQSPVRVTPRANKVQNNRKSDQMPKSTSTKPLSDKPPRISSMIQDRDAQLLLELDSALNH